jgi:hypothetical protein
MSDAQGWSSIEREAAAFHGVSGARFPLPAYSESMPPPYVGIKPYAPHRAAAPATAAATDEGSLDVTEYEQALELEPGLDHVAERVIVELGRLVRGEGHALSHTLLDGNPAWPAELAEAARAGTFARGPAAAAPLAIILPLALSRTQDDKGNVRWTLFGASHEGASTPFYRSFGPDAEADPEATRARFHALCAWAAGDPALQRGAVAIVADPSEVAGPLRDLVLHGPLGRGHRVVFTLRAFASLPEDVRRAHLAGRVTLVPSPASLIVFEHRLYRKLARELPLATQIPLLHLFHRVGGSCALRVPQSGWIEERDPAQHAQGHRIVSHVARPHRWERLARDGSAAPDAPVGDGQLTDKVSVALFSTKPDDLGLYGKPMARNAHLWFETYELLLDGQLATPAEIARAGAVLDAGGRFGYRFFYPPMQAGPRALYWHLPLVARHDAATGRTERWKGLLGHVTAERVAPADPASATPEAHGAHAERVPHVELAPRLLDRPGHREAARSFPHEVGHARLSTTYNARKLLEMGALLARPLPTAFARRLLHVARDTSLDAFLDGLAARATDREGGERLVATLRRTLGPHEDPGPPLTFDATSTRSFEESVWRTIASLAEGAFRGQENADPVAVNEGRSGGAAARAVALERAERRDLEALGDHLHARYHALVAKHGMTGRARVADHVLRWETDFPMPWSEGWAKNQTGEAHERNVVLVIPGRNRGEAVIMGDHYDTAYMEDVYEPGRGGDMLRAAASGADDNHSATTALLHAADVLLPMARDGLLERDVWLVHLTGEEFPADCLGARALARGLVERNLAFVADAPPGSGAARERLGVSATRVVGAFVLDMIGHNTERDRDVFQIAPGEGAASARLALEAHRANERWNRAAATWNHAGRRGLGRAQRMPDGAVIPEPFAHLALAGEVRTEWEPRSALYNTDGQIFSDVGVPVVLFMENYDIRRSGYHDTHDTMKNIDLDYCAALTAIAIETVAAVACATDL